MCRRDYPSDLTDEEWRILEPWIPPEKPGGRPRTTDMREVINAILSPSPHRSPMASLAARVSPPLPRSGTIFAPGAMMARGSRCMIGCVKRLESSRDASQPHLAAIIDSQSVKTREIGGGAALTVARA